MDKKNFKTKSTRLLEGYVSNINQQLNYSSRSYYCFLANKNKIEDLKTSLVFIKEIIKEREN